ncbi:hypothetical protein HDU87_008107 [Geranomyces variabilis]|uniref:Uncharacterized protein n=1 Tax=Geranomyces variabilis TaxID=109894 RepID=A0AAD5XUQ7_9FUNG|nr:hypothetical protein HDU87_008107 [Geranomyces variabilis]
MNFTGESSLPSPEVVMDVDRVFPSPSSSTTAATPGSSSSSYIYPQPATPKSSSTAHRPYHYSAIDDRIFGADGASHGRGKKGHKQEIEKVLDMDFFNAFGDPFDETTYP